MRTLEESFKMKLCVFVNLFLAFVSLGFASEPNWNDRYNQIKNDVLTKTPAPKIGDLVTITRRIGGDTSGPLSAITENTVVVGGREYQVSELTPETARKIFAKQYASSLAKQQVKKERDEYMLREQQELASRHKAQQERIRIEANQELERQRIDQRQAVARDENLIAPTQPQNIKNTSGSMITILAVIAIILGVLLYILPSIIAFKRGHQNAVAILAVNILLGWTFLGWVAAFVWSVTAIHK